MSYRLNEVLIRDLGSLHIRVRDILNVNIAFLHDCAGDFGVSTWTA